MRTRLRDGAQEKRKKQNTQKTGLCKHWNLVNCIHTPHPPNNRHKRCTALHLSEDGLCVLHIEWNKTSLRSIFSAKHTFFFLYFLSTALLSGWQYCSCSLYHKVKVRGGWEKDAKLKHCQTECPVICWQAPTFTCGVRFHMKRCVSILVWYQK